MDEGQVDVILQVIIEINYPFMTNEVTYRLGFITKRRSALLRA